MRISTLHKMIGMKCDEVGTLSYLTLTAHTLNRRFYIISDTLKMFGISFSVETKLPFEGWIRPPWKLWNSGLRDTLDEMLRSYKGNC